MQKVTVSLEEQHLALLEERQEEGEAGSRSAAVRQILDEYEQLHTEYEQLRTEYAEQSDRLESREARIEQIEEQLAKRQQIEDKIEALPEKVRETESYQDRRRRVLDQAGALQRLKWRVTGVPAEKVEPQDSEGHARR